VEACVKTPVATEFRAPARPGMEQRQVEQSPSLAQQLTERRTLLERASPFRDVGHRRMRKYPDRDAGLFQRFADCADPVCPLVLVSRIAAPEAVVSGDQAIVLVDTATWEGQRS